MKTSENKTYNITLIYQDESEEKYQVTCSCNAAAMMMARGLMLAASCALLCVVEDTDHHEVITYVV